MLPTTEVHCFAKLQIQREKKSTGTLIMHDTSCLAYAKEIPSLHVKKSGIKKI
jgi:hypothetical protein